MQLCRDSNKTVWTGIIWRNSFMEVEFVLDCLTCCPFVPYWTSLGFYQDNQKWWLNKQSHGAQCYRLLKDLHSIMSRLLLAPNVTQTKTLSMHLADCFQSPWGLDFIVLLSSKSICIWTSIWASYFLKKKNAYSTFQQNKLNRSFKCYHGKEAEALGMTELVNVVNY